MSKTKIFIDFDDTLFDTAKVKRQMFAKLETLGFSMEQILDSYSANYIEKGFTIEGFLQKLKDIKSFDIPELAKNIREIYESVGVFDDTLDFLENIDRDNFEVNLLTFGSLPHQKFKVKISGLEKYFDNLYYTQIFKAPYLLKILPPNASFIFIDNLQEVVVDIAKAFSNVTSCYIIRDDTAVETPLFKNIKIIKTLKEVLGK